MLENVSFAKLAISAIVLTCSLVVSRVLQKIVRRRLEKTAVSETTQVLFLFFLRCAVFSISGLIVLDTLGVSITPILASLGVGSLAVALALQDTLGNLFSGFYILIDRPLAVGELIRTAEGVEGRVGHIGWRSTTIELGSGATTIIPNSKLSSTFVTNFDRPARAAVVLVTVRVAFENNLASVEKSLFEAAQSAISSSGKSAVVADDGVKMIAFQNNGIDVAVTIKTPHHADAAIIKHHLILKIHELFARSEITYSKSLF